jgi:FKBP-type peptidyl-prolyl cis-trans isomerase SlyD
MSVSLNKVVSIHYTLTNNQGTILDTSIGKEPLVYIHGMGHLIPGMEEGIHNRTVGDKLTLNISPEKGYGVRDERMVQEVPIASFNGQDIKVGMQFEAGSGEERFIITITAVNTETATIDGNHPLAGVELNFEVELLAIREATEEELAHGHVHGPGGHHH